MADPAPSPPRDDDADSGDESDADAPARTRRTRHSRWFSVGIRRLVQTHPARRRDGGKTDTTRAMYKPMHNALNILLRHVGLRWTAIAFDIAMRNARDTLWKNDFATVVTGALPPALAASCHAAADAACVRYDAARTAHAAGKDRKADEGKRAVPQSEKAGITLSVAVARRVIASVAPKDGRIGALAPVYLAAALEQLASEIVTRSVAVADGLKCSTLRVSHLKRALTGAPSLREFVENNRIELVGGGVLPGIDKRVYANDQHKRYLRKKRNEAAAGRRNAALKETAKGGKGKGKGKGAKPPVAVAAPEVRRKKPGEASCRAVRTMQAACGRLLAHATFTRIGRGCAGDTAGHRVRFASKVLRGIQLLCEQLVVDVVRDALQFTLINGQTLNGVEIALVASRFARLPARVSTRMREVAEAFRETLEAAHVSAGKRPKKRVESDDESESESESDDDCDSDDSDDDGADADGDATTHIPRSALQRMCQRAGCVRVSKKAYPVLDTLLRALTEHYVTRGVSSMRARKVRTVTFQDVSGSVQEFDHTILIFPDAL